MEHLLTMEQAAERLAIGRTTAYALAQTGELQTVRIGKARRVPSSAVDQFIARLAGRSADQCIRASA